MDFLFVIWESVEMSGSDELRGAAMSQMTEFIMGAVGEGKITGGGPLVPDGAQLRRRGGRLVVTDGPFVETKEVIGGFFTVSAPSWEAAMELAARCPAIDYGAVEVHPIVPMHPAGDQNEEEVDG
jgi:hypothetical protein